MSVTVYVIIFIALLKVIVVFPNWCSVDGDAPADQAGSTTTVKSKWELVDYGDDSSEEEG